MSKHDSPAFKRFKEKRAATTTDDQDYRDFVSSMTGEQAERDAGRAFHEVPGGREVPDDLDEAEVYRGYLAVLSGRAAELQAEATVTRELQEREEEILRHARITGGGLSSSHEHLRDRLQGFGRPHEGGRV